MLIVQLDGEVRYSYRYPFSAIDPQEYRWASDELILAGAWLLISEVSFHTFFGSLENFDSPKILSTSELAQQEFMRSLIWRVAKEQ